MPERKIFFFRWCLPQVSSLYHRCQKIKTLQELRMRRLWLLVRSDRQSKQGTKGQGHLLSCSGLWTAKKDYIWPADVRRTQSAGWLPFDQTSASLLRSHLLYCPLQQTILNVELLAPKIGKVWCTWYRAGLMHPIKDRFNVPDIGQV